LFLQQNSVTILHWIIPIGFALPCLEQLFDMLVQFSHTTQRQRRKHNATAVSVFAHKILVTEQLVGSGSVVDYLLTQFSASSSPSFIKSPIPNSLPHNLAREIEVAGRRVAAATHTKSGKHFVSLQVLFFSPMTIEDDAPEHRH
jgi:hypothetical protein